MKTNKKKRIVILLGAGFPLIWNAPTSTKIKDKVLDVIRSKPYGSEIIEIIQGDDSSNSFEYILAAIESTINFKLHGNNVKDFNDKLFRLTLDADINLLWSLYRDCINLIIELIEKYEISGINFEKENNPLNKFFNFLKENYHHINCYSLNYDELLPEVLGMPLSSCSLINEVQENNFVYDYYKLRKKKITYLNLHGSIHLHRKNDGAFRYKVKHSYSTQKMTSALPNSGGNPGETLLFTPIITGYNKSQRIISDHFSFPFTAFMNDLSDCDTFMAIGYSFGDPHINSQIYQYTKDRVVNYAFITKEDGSITDTPFENSFQEAIPFPTVYTYDTSENEIYHWNYPHLKIYKKGFGHFLEDESNWNICI